MEAILPFLFILFICGWLGGLIALKSEDNLSLWPSWTKQWRNWRHCRIWPAWNWASESLGIQENNQKHSMCLFMVWLPWESSIHWLFPLTSKFPFQVADSQENFKTWAASLWRRVMLFCWASLLRRWSTSNRSSFFYRRTQKSKMVWLNWPLLSPNCPFSLISSSTLRSNNAPMSFLYHEWDLDEFASMAWLRLDWCVAVLCSLSAMVLLLDFQLRRWFQRIHQHIRKPGRQLRELGGNRLPDLNQILLKIG